MSTSVPSAYRTSGLDSAVSHPSCGSSASSNNGCAFIDSSDTSYGKALNQQGGAVFAMEWTSDGIRIWNFPRDSVPADLDSQNPNPAKWSRLYMKAAWSSVGCDTKTYFKQHAVTFDTTLCGDWAGSAFRECFSFDSRTFCVTLTISSYMNSWWHGGLCGLRAEGFQLPQRSLGSEFGVRVPAILRLPPDAEAFVVYLGFPNALPLGFFRRFSLLPGSLDLGHTLLPFPSYFFLSWASISVNCFSSLSYGRAPLIGPSFDILLLAVFASVSFYSICEYQFRVYYRPRQPVTIANLEKRLGAAAFRADGAKRNTL